MVKKIGFAAIFLIPGIILIVFLLYKTIQFERITNGFTKARIDFVTINEKDTTGKTVLYNLIDATGKETLVVDEKINSDEGLPIFDEQRVRFNPNNPTKVYFENTWFGLAVGLVFGIIFIFIGYVGFKLINVFKKPRRIIIPFIAICTLIIGIGLLCDYVVSLEKSNEERFKYEYLALFIIVVASAILFIWMSIQKIWNEVDTLGNVLIIKDFNVIVNKKILASNSSIRPDLNNEIELNNTITGLPVRLQVSRDSGITINPFVIECKFIDENKKVHLYTTDKIWFNPTPFIKEELKVFVHPTRTKFYKIDTSFLPDVRFSFTDIEYRK